MCYFSPLLYLLLLISCPSSFLFYCLIGLQLATATGSPVGVTLTKLSTIPPAMEATVWTALPTATAPIANAVKNISINEKIIIAFRATATKQVNK